MSFRFKLSTPLRMREIAEEKEERLLTQILSRMAELRAEQSTIQRRQVESKVHCEKNLRQSMSASELQMYYAQRRSLEEAEEQIKQQLAECDLLRQQQVRAFQVAHQNREILSELRSRDLEKFRKVTALRDQQAMDDTFISRRRAD